MPRPTKTLRDAPHDPQASRYFKRYLPKAADAALSPPKVAEVLHTHVLLRDFSHPFYWAAFTYTGL